MVKEIKVYTRPTCAPCQALKKFLTYKGMTYKEVNVDEDKNAETEAFTLSGVQMVPVTVVTMNDGHQEVISGYNLGKLAQLAKA